MKVTGLDQYIGKRCDILLYLTLFLVVVGFADATYLTHQHYQSGALVCGGSPGCDIVTTSKYAVVGGIPIALMGAMYYVSVFALLIGYIIDRAQSLLLRLAFILSGVGVIVSGVLVYLQLFAINAVCIYCMASAATSTVVALLLLYVNVAFQKTER